jgi:hypothetical protein
MSVMNACRSPFHMAESFLPTRWSPSPPINFCREVVSLPMRVEDDEGDAAPPIPIPVPVPICVARSEIH